MYTTSADVTKRAERSDMVCPATPTKGYELPRASSSPQCKTSTHERKDPIGAVSAEPSRSKLGGHRRASWRNARRSTSGGLDRADRLGGGVESALLKLSHARCSVSVWSVSASE